MNLDDLNPETRQKVEHLVSTLGDLEAARNLGFDISHYDNFIAAGRLLLVNHAKNVPPTFTACVDLLKDQFNDNLINFTRTHSEVIEAEISAYSHHEMDCDWFSANTQINTYLLKPKFNSKPLETITYSNMRVAIQLHYNRGWDAVRKCFQEECLNYYTPASPTIFNAGRKKPQMSSCFLMTIEDSLESILYTGCGDAGMISKHQGGLGMDLARLRHSEIGNTGKSKGLIPIMQLYNSMIRLCEQGGMRKGAISMFNRPFHLDIVEYIQIVEKIGSHEERAHDINTSLWMPEIFWKRVQENGNWTIFCPAKTPQLNDVWGDELTRRYIEAESDLSIPTEFRKIMKARDLLNIICDVQRSAGMPFIMNSDACNGKSNQRHLGYIRSSNLCQEIVEYSDDDEIASCNLASISLRHFVRDPLAVNRLSSGSVVEKFNFALLGEMTRSVVLNLNQVIDHNWYPLDRYHRDGTFRKAGKIRRSNIKHRPIGVGVSGFAEMLHQMDLTFESDETRKLNKLVFASMYFSALIESVQLAIIDGAHESFPGSPFSEGKLQFDLWSEEFQRVGPNKMRTADDDLPIDPAEWGLKQPLVLNTADGTPIDLVLPTWNDLKRVVMKYGTRNSLLLALMPTATTSQKLRNCESVEAHLANVYSRKVLNGAYPVINRYLIDDLTHLGLWGHSVVEFMKNNGGSVKELDQLVAKTHPEFTNWTRLNYVQLKYRTMWELSQKIFLRMASERGRYIDQSQSTNIYLADPSNEMLSALHLMGHMLGLKTGMYYLRTKPIVEPIKFTADRRYLPDANLVCTKELREAGCLSCQ